MDRTSRIIQKSREQRIFRLFRYSLRFDLGILFVAFAAVDYLYFPNYWLEGLFLRLFWYAYVWLAVLLFTSKKFRNKADLFAAFMLILMCWEVNWMIFRTGGYTSYYITGLLLVNVVGLKEIGFPRVWAIGVSAICLIPTLFIIWITAGSEHWRIGVVQTAGVFITGALTWVLKAADDREALQWAIRQLKSLQELEAQLIAYTSEMERKRALEALSNTVKQVSHDIRSPLSVLKIAQSSVTGSEDVRVLIRESINRIQEITYALDDRQSTSRQIKIKDDSELSIELLSALIESTVSEKRMQFKDQNNLILDTEFNAESYAAFSRVNPADFKRVFSNLINNSVEAIADKAGEIKIRLAKKLNGWSIVISDTGPGIPAAIREKLGEQGASFGKPQGQGLGLYHAFCCVKSWGGEIKIDSSSKGTKVEVMLPGCPAPPWFASKLELKEGGLVVILDDDPSIHWIWEQRISALNKRGNKIKHISFKSGHEFKLWRSKNSDPGTFLFDYELMGEEVNGLDLIENFALSPSAYLITSHYQETFIRNHCERLTVKMVPKGVAGWVPIEIADCQVLK